MSVSEGAPICGDSRPRFNLVDHRSRSGAETNPGRKRRARSRPEKKAYREWINDHELILTQSERDAWKKTRNRRRT